MSSVRRYRNLHVPLPDDLDRRLREAAKRKRAPATAIARTAIASWLEEHERELVGEAVAEYARAMAGTEADLDASLEAEGADRLSKDDEGDA